MDELEQVRLNLAYMNITNLQNTITRMAENSYRIKLFYIATVSAIFTYLIANSKLNFLFTLIPTIIFLLLDAYYLSLEKHFINVHNKTIKDISDQNLLEAIYFTSPKNFNNGMNFIKAFGSPSIYIFYGFFLALHFVYFYLGK